MVNCKCGLPLATCRSWTSDNPGRQFRACKFFNYETGKRGCKVFEWIDQNPTDWQRDVINQLVGEKHRLAMENHILNMRVVSAERDLRKLEEDEARRSRLRRPELSSTIAGQGSRNVGLKCIVLSVVLSAFVSVVIAKAFN